MIARTPGNAAARVTSIATMRACGSVDLRILPCSMPGSAKSAPKTARPVTLPWASSRGTRAPTALAALMCAPALTPSSIVPRHGEMSDLDEAADGEGIADRDHPEVTICRAGHAGKP